MATSLNTKKQAERHWKNGALKIQTDTRRKLSMPQRGAEMLKVLIQERIFVELETYKMTSALTAKNTFVAKAM